MSGRWIQLLVFLQEFFQGAKSIVMKTSIVFGPKCQKEGVYDRKSDPHDVTDWSTDYMLYMTYYVTVLCTVLIKYKYLWRIVLNVCTSLTLQQFIYYQVYNP